MQLAQNRYFTLDSTALQSFKNFLITRRLVIDNFYTTYFTINTQSKFQLLSRVYSQSFSSILFLLLSSGDPPETTFWLPFENPL